MIERSGEERRVRGRGCHCTVERGGVFCPVHDANGPADKRLRVRRAAPAQPESTPISEPDHDGGQHVTGEKTGNPPNYNQNYNRESQGAERAPWVVEALRLALADINNDSLPNEIGDEVEVAVYRALMWCGEEDAHDWLRLHRVEPDPDAYIAHLTRERAPGATEADVEEIEALLMVVQDGVDPECDCGTDEPMSCPACCVGEALRLLRAHSAPAPSEPEPPCPFARPVMVVPSNIYGPRIVGADAAYIAELHGDHALVRAEYIKAAINAHQKGER